MLRSEAARYARWSAVVALVLATVTLLAYVRRDWVRHVEKKNAPPATPIDVSRQSAGLNFKKVDQKQTVFEVAASKSIEFKGKDASLLEDVRITIFGRAGDRHDVIHTQSCQYGRENGGIECSGEVQIDLMSAVDAHRTEGHPEAAKAVTTRIETRGVKFDRASGLAQTDQRVTFAFPSGTGEAVGLEYKSEEGAVRLLRDVRFTLKQSIPSAARPRAANSPVPAPQEVRVKGSSLDFGRDSRLLRLSGPAEAEAGVQRLTAGEINLALDKEFHATTLVASGTGANRPVVMSQGAPEQQMKVEADTLTAHFSPEGAVTRVDAAGSVHGTRTSATEQDVASSEYGSVELWPWLGRPKEVNLDGNVQLRTQGSGGESRMLRTNAFRLEFSKGESGQTGKVQKAETLAAGTMEWTDAGMQLGVASAKTKLQADKLAMDFASSGKARQLQAIGNVQTERAVTGRPGQTATARNGKVELASTGGWSQMDLDGDVKLKEGDRSGQGGHAVFVRASQIATLTGNAAARDASTETRAQKIIFAQASGDIRAEGNVRSTDFASRSSAVQLAPAAANITADTLQANSKTGRAFYSGHARLWQGDSVLEAESIEMLRETRVLNAAGSVRAVFPQAAPQSAETSSAGAPGAASVVTPTSTNASQTPVKKHLWHASSGTLSYSDKEGRAHLEQNVVVQSAEQRMRAPSLDLYFTRAVPAALSGAKSANPAAGAQQISRAVGTGGVIVEEGSRKATAEHGEYVAATGKFVMSGGNPTLYDGSAGTTTGRQLTFYLADDTIIVDSENGSRTLTKHRVEK